MRTFDASATEVAGAFPDGWVVVLCAPAGHRLSDDQIREAASALGTGNGPIRRLGPGAAETALPRQPGVRDWSTILPGIDVNAVPARGREKRLLVADMDSTIIGCECIDELADLAGVGAEVAAVTERAMAGELDFEGSLVARVAHLEGADAALIDRVWEGRIRLNPGAETLVKTMAARGAHTMLVSGGFNVFTERVAAAAGFAEHHANTLEIVDGRLTGRVVPPILGRAAKLEALETALADRGLSRADAIAVGDGANDLAMVEAAGLGVAYRAKPVLAAAADARIDCAGLDALLALQGIATPA